MEEASVAGESPDRSKQRESSEEPTSGSAGPVPEARTGASEPRDPRLPVTREDAERSTGSAESRGGVDTATRVLSVRETEHETKTEGGSGAGAEAPPEPDAKPEPEAKAEEPDSSDPEESTAADAETDAPGTTDTSDASESGGGDGRLRNAVAAWVATADERAAANARLQDGEAEEGAEKAPGGDGKPTGAAGTAEGAPGGDTEDSAAPESDDGGDADGDGDQDGGKREETTAPDTTDADADADNDSDADDDSDAAPDRPVDQPTAVFKAPRPDKPAVDQPTTMLKLGDAAAPSKAADKPDEPGKEEKGPKSDKGNKSDKAEKPDEPGKGSAADKDGKGGKGDKPSHPGHPRDVERTSKFVALRQPDDLATRTPPGTPPKPPSGTPRTASTSSLPYGGSEQTTQQPVPPKPPLDLLAELTNTPPPPETALRTTVRRVKIWTPLVVLLLIVLAVVQSMRDLPRPTLDLTAQESFTFEGGKPQIPWPSSGQAALDVQGIGTFGSSGDQKPVPIASVAKVMTAYVILRDHPLKSGADGPKIKIDQTAEDQSQAGQESTVDVTAGDSISQREALQSILIASANNVARLLARWDAGSEKAFVEKMNAAAKDLGMGNTTYTDPSGLNNTTVSTAVDQVKLAKEAMKAPAFREVAAMMSYDDYKGANHSNWNQLVGHNDVVGIKTGTTTSALGNLVFAAKKDVDGETRTIVGAVVRQPAGGADNTILGAALDSSDKLIRAAQDTLESSTIVKKGTVVGYVDDGLGGRTPVVTTQDVKAVGWAGLTVKLTFDADEVPHTAAAGTKVGSLTVGDGGTSGAVKVPVALRDELVEPGFSDKLTRLG
ncbi:D-alanyl-D-alanine carboxypeptidase [Streptomyces olivaceus]|uniref:D-alanyl-D-alanine carboxypeptidase n=1 Tax=Streptomyces olivaceus TaxID=47716 RepID=UPI001E5C2E9F|nr:D-alanyl-D-alanine carboxypeptidase [Streptomyces olivaceus]